MRIIREYSPKYILCVLTTYGYGIVFFFNIIEKLLFYCLYWSDQNYLNTLRVEHIKFCSNHNLNQVI